MVAVSKLTPSTILAGREAVDTIQDTLNECKGSLNFLEQEYEGDKKEAWIVEVRTKIESMENTLSNLVRMPTIAELKQRNEPALIDEVEWLILDTIQCFDVNKEVLVMTSRELAVEIIYNYSSLTFEDIMLCFKYARDGRYGPVYNRLDGQVIKSWLLQYWTELQKLTIEHNMKKHVQTKEIKRTISEEVSYRWCNPRQIREAASKAGTEG